MENSAVPSLLYPEKATSTEAAENAVSAAAENRIGWVDIARGITITLVMIGHSYISPSVQQTLQPFRMPLFYITTGYLFNFTRHRDALLPYLAARARRLMLPYFCTAFLFYGIWLLFKYFGPAPETLNPVKQFLAIFLANGAAMVGHPEDYTVQFDIPLWFLGCMTSASVIFVILIRCFKNEKNKVCLLISSLSVAVLGYAIGQSVFLPWSFDVAMMAQFFMVIGFLLRENNAQFTDVRVLLCLSVAYLAICFTGHPMDMNRRIYHDFGELYVAGLGGTYLIYFISRHLALLKETDPLARHIAAPWEFLGKHSMVIMVFHWGGYYVREFADNSLLPHRYHDPNQWWSNLLWMMATSLAAIAVVNAVRPLRKIYYK